jgi:hypothetical protein
MATYWMSFRLNDDRAHRPTYEQRYEALVNEIDASVSRYWAQTSSFFVFESSAAMAPLAAKFKAAISPQIDLFIMREMDTKNAVICGHNNDADIFVLMPYLKKV